MRRKRNPSGRAMAALVITGITPLATHAATSTGTLYFSTFRVANPLSGQVFHDATVDSVTFTYDSTAKTFSLSPISTIADLGATGNADGLIFATNGNLLIGGSTNGNIVQITKTGSTVGSVAVTGSQPFHLSLSPDGNTIYSGGTTTLSGGDSPGPLGVTPFFSTGTTHTLTGDSTGITQIAFDSKGNAFYTSSPDTGTGTFGKLTLSTFDTASALTNLPAAHGITFDSFTGDFILAGANHITQVDPTTMAVVSDLTVPGVTMLDQVSSDGQGHLFVTDNGNVNILTGTGTNGSLVFLDITGSKLVASPTFQSTTSVTLALDDIAPLSGPGAPTASPPSPPVPPPTPPPPAVVPLPASAWMGLSVLAPIAAAEYLRRRRRRT